MFVNKLNISPIYTGPGISKKVCSISLNNVDAERAAEFIKERLHLIDTTIPAQTEFRTALKSIKCDKFKKEGLYI